MSQIFLFRLRVVDSEGRAAELPDTIIVDNAPAAGTVTLSPRTVVATAETMVGEARTVSASFSFGNNSRLTASDGFSSAAEWGLGVTPSAYQIRITPTAPATFAGPAPGVWHTLDTTRTWTATLTASAAAAAVTTALVEIRDVATSTIRGSATFTWDLSITEIPAQLRLTDRTVATSNTGYGPSTPSTTGVVSFRNDGKLEVFWNDNVVGDGSAGLTSLEVPNEWGRFAYAAAYEVRFTPLIDGGMLSASIPWNTWRNLATAAAVESNFVAPADGVFNNTSKFRAEIRPVAGAVVLSAEFTFNHRTEWNSSGTIP